MKTFDKVLKILLDLIFDVCLPMLLCGAAFGLFAGAVVRAFKWVAGL